MARQKISGIMAASAGWNGSYCMAATYLDRRNGREKKGILVVMPDMKLSYGLDMKYGFAYEKTLTQELPELIADYFPVDLNNQMIIGVKEGGYAALRAAFRHPEQYQMAASYSCGSLTEERVPEELHKQVRECIRNLEAGRTPGYRI